jgi:ABC-2 type transport system permease protein
LFGAITATGLLSLFILSVFLCFVFFFAFEGLATYLPSAENFISSMGMDNHFKSMSRGVIDTRDVLYFISLTILFLSLTVFKLKSSKA